MNKWFAGVMAWCVWAVVAVATTPAVRTERDVASGTVTQWSTIDALLKGYYDGVVTLGEVKRHGDFGLGTFEGLDGEMIVLDGTVYQVEASGAVKMPADDVRTPFAAVVFFEKDIELEMPAGLTLEHVQARIDAALPTANAFYAVRVTGAFEEVRTRSVGRQEKPYPELAEVVKTQALFTLKKTEGTLVGLKCPVFSKSVNVPGHHFHFLAADRKSGGHVLGLVTGEGVRVSVSVVRNFVMKLPSEAGFDQLDLSGDRSKELHAVESERK